MDEKLKYSLLRDSPDTQSIWTRNEKRLWFVTLWLGTCMLYSTRTTMPLLVPAVAAELRWSKTDSGTVLSSFFWGYTLTQVLGGYFSDRIGGQRVIYYAAIVWSLVTLFMPNILLAAPKSWQYSIPFIVSIRILNGASQGVHFPSMISLTSQNLSAAERTSFFSLLMSGSAAGTLLTGIMGSFILDYFGWQFVFRIIGALGVAWALTMRYYTMSSERRRVVQVSLPHRLCTNNRALHGGGGGGPGSGPGPADGDDSVPWLRLFRRTSFWACVLAHACQNNCFFVLLSWLPTYFHDEFPLAEGWVVNMVPWLSLLPVTLLGKMLTDALTVRKWSLTRVRIIVQSCCFLCQNLALLWMCHTRNFTVALICMTTIIGE